MEGAHGRVSEANMTQHVTQCETKGIILSPNMLQGRNMHVYVCRVHTLRVLKDTCTSTYVTEGMSQLHVVKRYIVQLFKLHLHVLPSLPTRH